MAVSGGVILIVLIEAKYTNMTYVMIFLWGIQDSATNVHLSGILGFEFESKAEPFGVFNLLQGFTCFICSIVQTFMVYDTNRHLIIYVSVTTLIGIVSLYLPTLIKFKKDTITMNIANSNDVNQNLLIVKG